MLESRIIHKINTDRVIKRVKKS